MPDEVKVRKLQDMFQKLTLEEQKMFVYELKNGRDTYEEYGNHCFDEQRDIETSNDESIMSQEDVN